MSLGALTFDMWVSQRCSRRVSMAEWAHRVFGTPLGEAERQQAKLLGETLYFLDRDLKLAGAIVGIMPVLVGG